MSRFASGSFCRYGMLSRNAVFQIKKQYPMSLSYLWRTEFSSLSSKIHNKRDSLNRKIEPLIVCNHKLLFCKEFSENMKIGETKVSCICSSMKFSANNLLSHKNVHNLECILNNYQTLEFFHTNCYSQRFYHSSSLKFNVMPQKSGNLPDEKANFPIISGKELDQFSKKPVITQHFEPNPLGDKTNDINPEDVGLIKNEVNKAPLNSASPKPNLSHDNNQVSTKSSKASDVIPAEKKKSLGRRFIDEVKHYYHGFRLLFMEFGISMKLLWKMANGGSLTRREGNQLITSMADLFRLIPFLVFVIVPFMEFLLPVALKLFPGMLPSTFQSKNKEQEKLRRNLKVKLEMAKTLQNTLVQVSSVNAAAGSLRATEFVQFMEEIRTSGEPISNEEIMKYSKLFEDEITLENLTRTQLLALCRMLDLMTIGMHNNLLRFQLRLRLRSLHYDDKMIIKEGLSMLNTWELQEACKARGMRSVGVTDVRLRANLQQWLDLHMNSKVPASLLLLSRTFILRDAMTPADRIRATISALPDSMVEIAREKVSETDFEPVDNKTKREIMKKEQAAIKLETELEKSKKTEEKKQEMSEAELLKKEILVDKAPLIEESAKELGEDIIVELDASRYDLKGLKVAFSKHMTTLSSMNVKDLIVMLSSTKTGKDAAKSKAASRLESRIAKMINKLDRMEERLKLTDVNEKIEDEKIINMEMINEISKKKKNLIGINELMNSINRLHKLPDGSGSHLKDIMEVLDSDHDGKVDMNSAVKAVLLSERKMDAVIELLGRENIEVSHDQLATIIDLLHSDVVKDDKKDEVIDEIIDKN